MWFYQAETNGTSTLWQYILMLGLILIAMRYPYGRDHDGN